MGTTLHSMSKKKLHQALTEYVTKKIVDDDSDLSPVEWVTVMNAYSMHESIQNCAEKTGLSTAEIKKIYYLFTMYAAQYALTHLD